MTATVVLHLLVPFLYNAQQRRLYTLLQLIALLLTRLLKHIHHWLNASSTTNTHQTNIEQKQSPITIKQRYLGNSIKEALQTSDSLIVHSPMGSGKTEAIKTLLKMADSHIRFAFSSPSTKLNRSIAKELGAHFYKDVLKEPNRKKRKTMAKRVVGTLQFFRRILKEFPDLKYDLFIMDEAQSLTIQLISNITRQQEATLSAVKKIAQRAKKVIAMDAHIGRETEVLMAILCDEAPTRLVNKVTPWQCINADILTGGKYSDRKKANDALQIEALNVNKKIVICSSSTHYCQLRYDVLSALHPEKKIGIITTDESTEAQALMDDPSLIRHYDVLILSPAVGIGVSFNAKNHIDICFGVFPNKRDTGDSYQAIQILARLRSPTDKQWIISLDDQHPIFTQLPNVPKEMGDAIMKQFKRNIHYAGLEGKQRDTETNDQLITLFQTCEHIRRDNKNHYNHYFMQQLAHMEVTINHRCIEGIVINPQSEQQTKRAKEQRKARIQQAKTEGKEINQTQFEQIEIKMQHHLETVTQEEKDSHTAFLFREPFNLPAWEMTEEQKQHYLHLDAIGASESCKNRDILNAAPHFIKKVIAVQLEGIGRKKAMKEDIISRKHNLLLYRKLLSYSNDYIDGTPYSHKTLKDGKMVRFVTKHAQEIVALDVISLPKDWKRKPAKLMSLLLRLVGYRIQASRKGSGKRNKKGNRLFDYTFSAEVIAEVDALFNHREQQQQTWVDLMQRRMDKYSETALCDTVYRGNRNKINNPFSGASEGHLL
jgi:hypothetical protein